MTAARPRVVVLGGAGAIFLFLLALAVVQGRRLGVDAVVHDWVIQHRASWLNGPARVATDAGSSPVLYLLLVVTALTAGLVAGRHPARLRAVAIIAVLLAVEIAVRTGLSIAVARARPPVADWLLSASGYSFPSGHTANATAAAGLLAVLVAVLAGPGWRRRAGYAGAALFASAVGISRVYLGVHWPSDVLAGWALGLCWAAGTWPLVARWAPARCCDCCGIPNGDS